MKKRIAMQWADALESGDYKQGTGVLRRFLGTNTQFCCLGVLCNLHALAHPDIAAENKNPYKYLGEGGTLPTQVQKWAGMRSSDGDVLPESAQGHIGLRSLPKGSPKPLIKTSWGTRYYSLMLINDTKVFTFSDIAKIIRERYKDL